jgi:hypothetical protein
LSYTGEYMRKKEAVLLLCIYFKNSYDSFRREDMYNILIENRKSKKFV